jgi:hypothetical protein
VAAVPEAGSGSSADEDVSSYFFRERQPFRLAKYLLILVKPIGYEKPREL